MVEKSVARNPILIEFASALQTSGAPHGFCQLLSVKPFQTKLLFPESLNEKANVYATGMNKYVKAINM
jgi:hypothetical protein